MDTFLRLERQMQDSMQNKIKQTTIVEFLLEINKQICNPSLACFCLLFE